MFVVTEWSFDKNTFATFSEALRFIRDRKDGVRDCCFIENTKTKEIWISDASGNIQKKKQEKLLSLF